MNAHGFGLSIDELFRWLDWMQYMRGIDVDDANTLSLAEPDWPEYPRARKLVAEWKQLLSATAHR